MSFFLPFLPLTRSGGKGREKMNLFLREVSASEQDVCSHDATCFLRGVMTACPASGANTFLSVFYSTGQGSCPISMTLVTCSFAFVREIGNAVSAFLVNKGVQKEEFFFSLYNQYVVGCF